MSTVPNVELNNGVQIPQLGFGVFQVPDAEVDVALRAALEAGYRSIDTAAIYQNEKGVGRVIAESDVPRSELFVTTKLWNGEQGYDATMRAFDESLRQLRLDYLDLYLIHWPVPSLNRYVDTWKAFVKLREEGRVRAIGVSNFTQDHLTRVIEETGVVPAVNQIELHPNFPQTELREFHARHGIATEAWAPLAQGGDLLRDASLAGVAEKHGRTPAQVVLRWHLQLGNIVIPKSVTPSRIRENIAVFDFELDDEDMATIARLETGKRNGPDPETFDVVG
ncbi:Aldo/keto reductase [Streptoalloteichus tenebrarius]|uniref:Aldo/keto reductase n=1 Tax=Streptoalloteichus tenebrarius (strain ATCC 17920 / DSM 40477 / JCM 4838 / CBS 697.72 / NBRC 16177 / NCIMB 11028 / NRRL B-12390 / A12253. 1 / ISP 5477) TaxID=1933 RepID=A0ABT1HSE8_STRSD|nr:aldo/keto reductase [Streptoalloteichus tenebrarius]MCP2258452.1 Aldo/keto reductase [Streptoalloteichus tenebrarius]